MACIGLRGAAAPAARRRFVAVVPGPAPWDYPGADPAEPVAAASVRWWGPTGGNTRRLLARMHRETLKV
ncbi:hypothetical protein GCM10023223_31650 [Stackebrandtia albiflava]